MKIRRNTLEINEFNYEIEYKLANILYLINNNENNSHYYNGLEINEPTNIE